MHYSNEDAFWGEIMLKWHKINAKHFNSPERSLILKFWDQIWNGHVFMRFTLNCFTITVYYHRFVYISGL